MIDELRAIGLTDGEINVYLTLLKLGTATNSPIARHAKLQSSTVYYCLNSLIEKGFVIYILKGNRKHFSAINPENIMSILEDREKELKEQKEKVIKIIPQLKKFQNIIKGRTIAEVYEGFKGFQTTFREIFKELKRGDQYEAFVIEQSLNEPDEIQLIFKKHNKNLKAKGIKLKLLASEAMRPVFEKMYGKRFLKTYQEIKYTKETIPVGITIYKDVTLTHIFEESKPISIKVKNPTLAEMYRNHFNFLWKQAKP